MGPTLATHREILAEAGNPSPVAGSTNRRQFDPREEPRALAGMRGSVRGVPSNGNPYRDHSGGDTDWKPLGNIAALVGGLGWGITGETG